MQLSYLCDMYAYTYEGYSESNFQWIINKRSMRKKLLYTKNTCILNLVTTGTEALVSGNKFSYAFVREICRLWAQPRFDAFHELIIVEALWSQPVFPVGKQVVVTRSEVRAVRRVVIQLPV
jgi:hypothetical protein